MSATAIGTWHWWPRRSALARRIGLAASERQIGPDMRAPLVGAPPRAEGIDQAQAAAAVTGAGPPDLDRRILSFVHHLDSQTLIVRLEPQPDLPATMDIGVVDQLGHDQFEIVDRLLLDATATMALDEPASKDAAGGFPREVGPKAFNHQ